MYRHQQVPQHHQEPGEESKTLYVGNLAKEVTQDYILYLFGQIGDCKSCKMIVDHTGATDPYCFVEFYDHKAAEHARSTMNGRVVIGKNIKVNWATTSAKKEKLAYSQRGPRSSSETYSLFVGDLTPDIDETILTKAFEPFGSVVDARVVKDMTTGHSRGYGFVAFSREADAELAKNKMNGYYLGGKALRTNWASRKQTHTKGETKDYKEVYAKSSEANTTVYIGNTPDNYKESDVRNLFEKHGDIIEIRVYPDRNYAFVKYSNHEQAATAICACHGTMAEDRSLKCDWGRDDGQSKSSSNISQPFVQQQHQHQAAYQQAALLYSSFSQQQPPFQQQPQQQQQFSGNPPPGIYGQQAFVGNNQSQMYPYFDNSMMMQTSQFTGYGQDNAHNAFMSQGSNTSATSQGGFGYQQQ